MTEENARQLVSQIKNGKKYLENIFEGYIQISFQNGKFVEKQYQMNPYTGEPREREYSYNEMELIKNIMTQDYHEFASKIV